jgi:hypothetical protein
LNARVNALSPTLMRLASTELLRVRASDAPDLTAHRDRNASRGALGHGRHRHFGERMTAAAARSLSESLMNDRQWQPMDVE